MSLTALVRLRYAALISVKLGPECLHLKIVTASSFISGPSGETELRNYIIMYVKA